MTAHFPESGDPIFLRLPFDLPGPATEFRPSLATGSSKSKLLGCPTLVLYIRSWIYLGNQHGKPLSLFVDHFRLVTPRHGSKRRNPLIESYGTICHISYNSRSIRVTNHILTRLRISYGDLGSCKAHDDFSRPRMAVGSLTFSQIPSPNFYGSINRHMVDWVKMNFNAFLIFLKNSLGIFVLFVGSWYPPRNARRIISTPL